MISPRIIRVSLATAVFVPALGLAQNRAPEVPPNPPAATVYYNPRAGADDPRIGLKGGLYDAAEAASGMQRLASLPKPTGFAPNDSVVVPPSPPPLPPSADNPERAPQGPPGQYGSTNSDMAFSGNHLFVGNYNGINTYDIDNPGKVKLRMSLVCPGGQGDVSVYGHLMFMSAEATNGRTDCGTQGIPVPAGYVEPPMLPPLPTAPGEPAGRPRRPPPPPSADRFRGVRIFDVSNMSSPKQVAAVQSCRGSHTHTLVIDPKDKENVYIYISGTGAVRQAEELAGCSGDAPDKDPNTALFRIDIIKVPLAHPEQAKIVAQPRIFADAKSGALNGLWNGGKHGEGTQTTSSTDKCHDITVYSALGLAAGACSGNGILLDIHNVTNPVRIDAVNDPNYAFWHSANFNNAGTKVLFTDEWGGGGQPRCRSTDPMYWGADAIFQLKGRKLTLQSYYKMPAPQTEFENCVAHNGSLVPIPGRDILVQSWYQGGISIVDFTDASHPFEVGYFDRGPVDPTKRAMGGMWSTYWYNGYIYSSEIARGVDVFKLIPNKFLTQNEIDASNQVHFDELNVQNQPKVTWPANFIVAKAYLDQLARGTSIAPEKVAALNAAIAKVEATPSDKKELSQLKSMAGGLDKDAAAAKTPADADRLKALATIVKQGGAGNSRL
ncbi:MAG TPA: hypothetical protein VG273_28530 [Bryobacteraceae bacterium]|jgi:hypothetical protein|nr:hypothetical protein [Bryobacteraceae bacterium]